MNMYLHELKSMRKSTVIWTCSMIAIALVYLSLYPSIYSDGAHFRDMLAGYPASIRAILGVMLDSVTTLPGFYSMIIAFVVLCGGIQAMNLGMSILSKETRERTADFLLVKPVSRAAVVTAKILAALTMLLVTDVVYYATAAIIVSAVRQSSYSAGLFLMINLTLFFIQLIFFAIGAVVSVFFDRLRSVLPVSLGTVFGCYIIGALAAALLNVIIINAVTLASFLIVVPLYSKSSNVSGEILTMTLSMLIVQLIFLSLGAVLAAWMKRPRAADSVATGILFTAYFIARITDMSDKLRFLNVISPFKYFDLPGIVAGRGLNPGVVALSLVLVFAFCSLTCVFYQKRDLNV